MARTLEKSLDDYYADLGLTREATMEEVREAYETLAWKHHPDRSNESGANDRMADINVAFGILKNLGSQDHRMNEHKVQQTEEQSDLSRKEQRAQRRQATAASSQKDEMPPIAERKEYRNYTKGFERKHQPLHRNINATGMYANLQQLLEAQRLAHGVSLSITDLAVLIGIRELSDIEGEASTRIRLANNQNDGAQELEEPLMDVSLSIEEDGTLSMKFGDGKTYNVGGDPIQADLGNLSIEDTEILQRVAFLQDLAGAILNAEQEGTEGNRISRLPDRGGLLVQEERTVPLGSDETHMQERGLPDMGERRLSLYNIAESFAGLQRTIGFDIETRSPNSDPELGHEGSIPAPDWSTRQPEGVPVVGRRA